MGRSLQKMYLLRKVPSIADFAKNTAEKPYQNGKNRFILANHFGLLIP